MAVTISVATDLHHSYAQEICDLIEESAKIRGTGIAKRKPEYITLKMTEGKAVIALDETKLVGFCYIETWSENRYVVNSGLIVHPDYRKTGLAKKIKQTILELSLKKYPEAKVFGITTSLAVMKINSDLGYKPVTFSELTDDDNFWGGCKSCVNYDILTRTNRKMCLCTGMIYEPPKVKPAPVTTTAEKKAADKKEHDKNKKSQWESFQRFLKFRQIRLKRWFSNELIKEDDPSKPRYP